MPTPSPTPKPIFSASDFLGASDPLGEGLKGEVSEVGDDEDDEDDEDDFVALDILK